jgi:hypothetical protein
MESHYRDRTAFAIPRPREQKSPPAPLTGVLDDNIDFVGAERLRAEFRDWLDRVESTFMGFVNGTQIGPWAGPICADMLEEGASSMQRLVGR